MQQESSNHFKPLKLYRMYSISVVLNVDKAQPFLGNP